VKTLVTRWKFKGHTGLTPYLVEVAGSERFAASDTPDAIVPVPPHWHRRFTRGFDQTWLLANSIAHGHPARPPVLPLLRRARSTSEQKRLSSRDRILNTRDAFVIDRPFTARYVALVDDVVTTGATVSACAETLLAAGVARVDIWCLVRVASPDEEV
jgi:ComF family protein